LDAREVKRQTADLMKAVPQAFEELGLVPGSVSKEDACRRSNDIL